MNISVIIPALNEANFIERAIESAWSAGAFEVIVVEGGSQDDTLALANAAGCKLIESKPGRAKQQNAGAELAGGDILLFQHADTRFEEESIYQIRELLIDDTIIAGGFRQQIEANGWMFRVLESGNARRVSRRGLPFGDQGIFIRREVFSQLGGFPVVPLMEDLILMKKVRRIAKPRLLPGPIYVSARRWQRHGVVRQTLRNHLLRGLHRCGASPAYLARFYRRHDQ